MTAPEFSRPERLDAIGAAPRSVTIAANAEERAALARRFDLASLDALAAEFAVRRETAGIVANGRVTATLAQACSVTGEPLPVTLDEEVALRFVPEGGASEDEIELGSDALDTMTYTGGAIDLGEAAAETIALVLDPFPRGPNASATLREAGVLSEAEAGPFGALAGLRDELEKK